MISVARLHQFALASLRLADAIEAHDFGLRERALLGFVRRLSFGAGRTEAYIPGWNFFERATGIKPDSAKKLMKALYLQRVVEERPQWFFGFLLPWDSWKVAPRGDQVEVIKQLMLIEAPKELPDALRETFVDQQLIKPGLLVPGISHEAYAPGTAASGSGVPKLGTASLTGGHADFGQSENGAMFTGPEPPSPDLGTSLSLEHCKNAGLKHCNNVPLGPDLGNPPEWVRFSREQQDVFDECGRLGWFGVKQESRGCWYDMVKRRHAVVRWLQSEYRYAKLARTIGNPGGYAMSLWKMAGKPERPPV